MKTLNKCRFPKTRDTCYYMKTPNQCRFPQTRDTCYYMKITNKCRFPQSCYTSCYMNTKLFKRMCNFEIKMLLLPTLLPLFSMVCSWKNPWRSSSINSSSSNSKLAVNATATSAKARMIRSVLDAILDLQKKHCDFVNLFDRPLLISIQ